MSEKFSELPPELQRTLEKQGYAEPTSVQAAVIASDSIAKDLRISSQTGSGKTVAVGIAIARELLAEGKREGHKNVAVLALTPTRELAAQVQRELAWLLKEVEDASVQVVTGGTSVGMERKSLARGPRIVVGTPGRVLEHLSSGALKSEAIRMVVLDEADQMFDMGFRDELQGILEELPARQRTHLVSATFSGEVQRIAERYQEDPLFIEGSPLGSANSDIEHIAHVVDMRSRYDALVNIMLLHLATESEGGPGRTLIFTRTRAETIEIAEKLQRDGIRAEPMSGELPQAQRTRTLNAFRSGAVSTIVATDVAARGLDVQGVELVVHYDPPSNADTFTHRSGRTGRAGQKGRSVIIMPPQARRRVERLLHEASVKASFSPPPSSEKILKAYQKIVKRHLFELLSQEEPLEELAYAEKILIDAEPKKVVAALLSLAKVEPPTQPREISTHFSHDRGGRHRDGGGSRGFKRRGGGYRDRDGGGRSQGGWNRDGGGNRGGGFHGRGKGPRQDNDSRSFGDRSGGGPGGSSHQSEGYGRQGGGFRNSSPDDSFREGRGDRRGFRGAPKGGSRSHSGPPGHSGGYGGSSSSAGGKPGRAKGGWSGKPGGGFRGGRGAGAPKKRGPS
ncbi:MAG: DEAD/DEAH box helicase [Polyangiaceae bacterium]|nr:DEAD/DEAH box helicase [Polyangiaceae bacterium]